MTERDMLLKKIGTLKFAVTDIDLFLDTHPGDKATMKKREEYLDQLKPLVREYEEKYGPLTPAAGEGVEWLKNPWPWDIEGGD